MKAYDEAAQEHIDRLQSQLDASDIENDELLQTIKDREQVIKSLQMQVNQMLCD